MVTTQEHKFYSSSFPFQCRDCKIKSNMKLKKRATPLETFYEYLKGVLVSSKILHQEQVREVFLRALKDYFDEKINLQYLAVVATQLYYELNKPYEIDTNFDRDLVRALSDATEIDWYHDHKDEDLATKRIYKGQLKNLKEYYEKNKDFLKNLPKTQ